MTIIFNSESSSQFDLLSLWFKITIEETGFEYILKKSYLKVKKEKKKFKKCI